MMNLCEINSIVKYVHSREQPGPTKIGPDRIIEKICLTGPDQSVKYFFRPKPIYYQTHDVFLKKKKPTWTKNPVINTLLLLFNNR